MTSFLYPKTLTLARISLQFPRICSHFPYFRPFRRSQFSPYSNLSTSAVQCSSKEPTFTGIEEALMGFISGKRKTTEVAHSVWKNIVKEGDAVVDATCGNGLDSLALLKMVANESVSGCVYAMDIQDSALKNTSSLLEASANEAERKLVKLFKLCHSKMEDIIPKDAAIRLVAFNLGYLPGGDKTIITVPETTLAALQAASRIVQSGGLISIMNYVGHPGGRLELETVESFASSLPAECWVSCKFEMLNRSTCPVLILIFRK